MDGREEKTMDMKKLAGDKAATYVKDGMVVGLGTGSTAYHMVNAVGEMVGNGLKIQAIPTSKATEAQARELGIPLLTIDELDHVDLAIDGVDEIDPEFNAIKGGGGALYREKVVASMEMCIRDRLITFPVPTGLRKISKSC